MRVLEASRQHSQCNYRATLRICFSPTRLLKRVLQNWYVPNSWLFLLEPELDYGVFQDELLKDDAGKKESFALQYLGSVIQLGFASVELGIPAPKSIFCTGRTPAEAEGKLHPC